MKKVSLVVILLIIALVATGIVYFLVANYIQSSQKDMASMSPKDVYLALKKEAAATKNLDDMMVVYKKYLTNSFFQENKVKVQAIPADQRVQVFETLKSSVVPLKDINVEAILEDIKGNNAIVMAYTKNSGGVGIINSTKENGIWKVSGPEEWLNGESK
jgi:Flp pilus assembly protein CpaB